jgi:hypothetical protein
MADAVALKDRRVGLVLFGILEILIGCLFALMLPFVALMTVLSGEFSPVGGATNLRLMIPTLSFYIVIAVTFVSLGNGSCHCKRWARTLSLIVGWIWLISGVVALVFWMVIGPGIFAEIAAASGEDLGSTVSIVLAITTVVLAAIYVVLPAAFVLFYRSAAVKATCERRDPHLSWTEKVPEPVLMLSLGHAALAYFLLWLAAYNWAVPFFGTILTGVRGAAVVVPTVVLSAWLARALYRQRRWSWWTALALAVGMTAGPAVTLLRVGVLDYYAAMDYPPEQIAMLRDLNLDERWLGLWPLLLFTAAYVGYLLYARRHFTSTGEAREPV